MGYKKKEEPRSMKIVTVSGKFLRIFRGAERSQMTNKEGQEGRYPSTNWLTIVLTLVCLWLWKTYSVY